jgi:hypothetical protein
MNFARTLVATSAFATLLNTSIATAQTVAELDPHVTVRVDTMPPAIHLRWNMSMASAGYTVSRRTDPTENFQRVAMLPATATSYDDTMVGLNTVYEYSVRRSSPPGNAMADGNSYVMAGIDVAYPDARRDVVLVIGEATLQALPTQLDRLEADLQADGWTVGRVIARAAMTPPMIRAALQQEQLARGEFLKAAFLIGAVPRAFSGQLRPDGHPDHEGAWPADGYYADLDGTWTDTVNYPMMNFNANRAGDGKFDQSEYPSELDIAVGRVDAEGMPLFMMSSTALVGRYLDRNHAYRVGEYTARPRTFVSDNFGYFMGEAFARAAWRDGNAILGSDPDSGRPFFDALEDPMGGYALSFACGGGNPTGAGGVGSTMDFVQRHPRTIFMGLFGSYFGDWSYENNFLRAPLFSDPGPLATTWFARPWVHLHSLGAMRSFGQAFVDTVQNFGAYDSGNSRNMVHQALLGDPTLRMFVTKSPSMLSAIPNGSTVLLRWTASPDMVVGYHVYRSELPTMAMPVMPVQRLTMTPEAATMFVDTTTEVGKTYRYRVVAVARVQTGSGVFFNHSPGVFAMATATAGAEPPLGTSDGGADGSVMDGGAARPMPVGCACVVVAPHTHVWSSRNASMLWLATGSLVTLMSRARRGRSTRARSL